MFNLKKRLDLRTPSRRKYYSRKGRQLENLESRRLLAAAVMETMPLDQHDEVHPGIISSATAGDAPIVAFIVKFDDNAIQETPAAVLPPSAMSFIFLFDCSAAPAPLDY